MLGFGHSSRLCQTYMPYMFDVGSESQESHESHESRRSRQTVRAIRAQRAVKASHSMSFTDSSDSRAVHSSLDTRL